MRGRQKYWSILAAVVLITLCVPSIQAVNVTQVTGPRSTSDWWPMLCHDPAHTGFSTSTLPDNIRMQWDNTTIGFIESSPSIVDGKVYVTTADFSHWEGYLYCYDAQTGVRQWVYDGQDEFFASPTVSSEHVFACTLNGKCYCLDAATGVKLWNVKLGSHLMFENSAPVVVDGRVYLCSYKDDGSYNGSIFCLDADTGSILWQISPGTNRDYAPAVANGRLYAAGANNQLSCFDAVNGSLLWVCPEVVLSTHPSVFDDKVYAGSQDGSVCCVDNGSILWAYQPVSNYLATIPCVFMNGYVYTGLYSPQVYKPDILSCLDVHTGVELWSRHLEEKGGVGYIPAVADGKLIVLSSFMYDYPPAFDRMIRVWCYNATSGHPLWNYSLKRGMDNYAYNSPGIADGRLFVCTTETNGSQVWGGVYCFSAREYSTPSLQILKPGNALYLFNKKLLPLAKPLIVGGIDIEINATDNQTGINRVEIFIDSKLVSNDTVAPYMWTWNEKTPFHWQHTLKVIAYNNAGNSTTKELSMRKFL